jgi:hypothetical protein
MQCIIHPTGNYLNLLGTCIHMAKREIAGVDFATGATIATDSIQQNGTPFKVIESDQAQKILGVHISMTGDFFVCGVNLFQVWRAILDSKHGVLDPASS